MVCSPLLAAPGGNFHRYTPRGNESSTAQPGRSTAPGDAIIEFAQCKEGERYRERDRACHLPGPVAGPASCPGGC